MKSFSFNVLSLVSSDIGSRLIGFLAVTYLARILGPENIGILAVGMATLTFSSIVSSMGIPLLGVRFVAANISPIQNLVKKICTARFLLSIISFTLSIVILMLCIEEKITRNISIIFLISMFPSSLKLEWLFQGLGKMRTLSIGQVLGMFAYLLFILGGVSNTEDIYLVPYAWCFGVLIQTIYLLFEYKKLDPNNNSNKQTLSLFEIIKQALPIGTAEFLSQIIIQFPFFYIWYFDTIENTGLYSVAFRVVILMLIIDRVFYTIFFPSVSQSFKKSLTHLKEKIEWTLKIIITCSLYVAILALLAGKDLLPLIFGSEFHDSGLIFQILLGYFVLTIINSVFTFTLIGIEKERLYTKSIFMGGISFFIIIFIPLPVSAIVIAPIALAVYQAVSMFLMMLHLRQSILINPFFRVLLPVLVSLVFALCIVLWQSLYPILVTITTIILALPTIAMASGINQSDINRLKGYL